MTVFLGWSAFVGWSDWADAAEERGFWNEYWRAAYWAMAALEDAGIDERACLDRLAGR
jgi:hypothetical protein